MKKIPLTYLCIIALVAFAAWAANVSAYDTYQTTDGALDNCSQSQCHPGFDTVGGPTHQLHTAITNDCTLCHTDFPGNIPVYTMPAPAGDNLEGCRGCHGVDNNTGDGIPNFNFDDQWAVGLRAFHENPFGADQAGACSFCHSTDVAPLPENTVPLYYGLFLGNVTDPCADNLNNDGNDDGTTELLDANDPACQAAVCGNSIVEAGEQCDDGNTLDGDCCSSTCQFEAVDSPCPDGQFCNGSETCDGAGSCQAGTPVDCNDGVGCTDDSCDEAADACMNTPNDANCPDDALFCNGTEFCDALADCSSTGDPCPAGTVCNETTDTCGPAPACGDGILDPGEECDDGNTLDGDCCSANCTFEPAGSSCADGEFCNGEETCDGAGTCQPGTPVDCDDGVDCTLDACNEVNDTCVNTPNDNNCPDDGLFCTGQEICDPVVGCVSTGDPCPAGSVCKEDTDTCDVVTDKVTLCHKGKNTIAVGAAAVPAHLRHGDTLGQCP